MVGRLGKAPCGHDGEAVIGQFYSCMIGCDKPGYVTPAPIPDRVPDHLDKCACDGCKCLRKATHVRLFCGRQEYARLAWTKGMHETIKVPGLTVEPRYIDRAELGYEVGTTIFSPTWTGYWMTPWAVSKTLTKYVTMDILSSGLVNATVVLVTPP